MTRPPEHAANADKISVRSRVVCAGFAPVEPGVRIPPSPPQIYFFFPSITFIRRPKSRNAFIVSPPLVEYFPPRGSVSSRHNPGCLFLLHRGIAVLAQFSACETNSLSSGRTRLRTSSRSRSHIQNPTTAIHSPATRELGQVLPRHYAKGQRAFG